MKVYFREQSGDGLIEKGKILKVVKSKKFYIVTGESEEEVIRLGSFEEEEEAKKVFNEIIERVVCPRAREIEAGIIYIDLNATLQSTIEKLKEYLEK